MLPQDVPYEVGCQVQKAILAQCAKTGSVHGELEEVHVLQAELVHCPQQPFSHMAFCPLPGVCRVRQIESVTLSLHYCAK